MANDAAVQLRRFCANIVQDFADAIDRKDLVIIGRSSYLLQDSINHELLSAEQLKAVADLMESGAQLTQAWVESLGEGAEFDTLADDGKWYQATVVARDAKCVDGLERIHFPGWPDKYDRYLRLADVPVHPRGTFIFAAPKKNKPAAPKARVEYVPVSTDEPPHTPGPTEEADVPLDSSSGRPRRRSAAPPAAVPPPTSTNKKAKSDLKRLTKEEFNEKYSDWSCMVCGQLEAPKGSDLLVCAGGCLRAAHCECEHIDTNTIDEWLCEDCTQGVHACWACGQCGVDNVDVFKCHLSACGKYYHINCLDNPNAAFVPVPGVKKSGKEVDLEGLPLELYWARTHPGEPCPAKQAVQGFYFKCPRHYCDTCVGYYGPVDASQLEVCLYCPRAFHCGCISPGCRFNRNGLICPLHPHKPLLTTKIEKEKKGSARADTIALFWDQLPIPEGSALHEDSRFFLDVRLRREVDSMPQNYVIITKNDWSSFPEDKVPEPILPEEGCECTEQCDERCLNRALRVECWDALAGNKEGKVCACGVKACNNRALQRKQYVDTDIFKEGDMGWGLRTCQEVRRGQLIIEYMGEIIDEAEMQQRMVTQATLTPHDKDYYVMELDTGIYVDGKRRGNPSRFINHSCDPNCELQKWNVKGRMRIAIVAIKDIEEGESLSYDYQFDTREENVFKCYCGAAKCRGTMAPAKKHRLAAQALTSTDKELRKKLIKEGLAMLKKLNNVEALRVDEMTRSCTGRFLPGDSVHEIRHGPAKALLHAARGRRCFLVRNTACSQGMLRRKAMLERRVQINLQTAGRRRRTKTKASKAAPKAM